MIKIIINYNTEKEQVVELAHFPCTIGRSPENDISIEDESISNFHVRIEREDNCFVVVDLNQKSGTYFKNKVVKEKRLSHGDVVRLGGVNILFEIDKADSLNESLLPERIDKNELVSGADRTCPNCGAFIDPGKSFCSRCGYRKGGVPSTDVYVEPMEKRAMGGAGILPFLSFVFSLFGPFILGLGWLLGIVLGVASIAIIRKRGGFVRDRRMALSGIVIGIIWFVVISIAGIYYFYQVKSNEIIARNEKQAVMALKNIAVAEQIAKSAYCFDEDANGVAEYASLKELEQLKVPLINKQVLKGTDYGYKLEILQHNEQNFICEAVPEVYGLTGKRSFLIEADGFIRGNDLSGVSPMVGGRELPVLFQGKAVFADYREEIARKLLRLAEKAAKEGRYKISKQIIEEIRTNYFLTEIQKELDSIAMSVDPFIVDHLSKELYEKAEKEIASGNLIRAKNIFQEIYDKYPDAEVSAGLKKKMDELALKIDEELSEEVKLILDQAKLDYQNGKYEEALKKYEQIAKMYPDTKYVEKNKALIEKLIAEGEEKVAEELLAQVMRANIEKDFIEIERIITLLQTNYGQTVVYKDNAEKITNIMNNCLAHNLLDRSLKEKQEENPRNALNHLEKAIEANPNLKTDMLGALTELYGRVGDKYVDEKDYVTAVSYYSKLAKLDSQGTLIDENKFKKAFYESGRILYDRGDYNQCKTTLLPMDKYFQKDKDFYYLLANACLKINDYENAVKYYSICCGLDNSLTDYKWRRGLAHTAIVLDTEEKLTAILQIKKLSAGGSGNKEKDALTESSPKKGGQSKEENSQEEQKPADGEDTPAESPSLEQTEAEEERSNSADKENVPAENKQSKNEPRKESLEAGYSTIEETQELFYDIAQTIVDIVNKGLELTSYFGVGSENKTKGLLEKEKAVAAFLKRSDLISDTVRECNKRDFELFEGLKKLKSELKSASEDLELTDETVFYFGADLKKIETDINRKKKLIDKASEVGFDSLKKLYALRIKAVAELRKRTDSFQRDIFTSDGSRELNRILSGQIAGLRTDISRCRQKIIQSIDIDVDIKTIISEIK